ncbi:glycoside hydrolase family 3 protein [Dendrothele bispora CBS 962.96]|uniref:beta-glucosidase n=1 Tax=Dendrothele bispora (strain CBS 962.96) TaxID=1314807 RepID=A0A4S8L002_DENBC|nr:glycoside hydrolase family 3 protein [Dendrothele bispora CBS 962.96]
MGLPTRLRVLWLACLPFIVVDNVHAQNEALTTSSASASTVSDVTSSAVVTSSLPSVSLPEQTISSALAVTSLSLSSSAASASATISGSGISLSLPVLSSSAASSLSVTASNNVSSSSSSVSFSSSSSASSTCTSTSGSVAFPFPFFGFVVLVLLLLLVLFPFTLGGEAPPVVPDFEQAWDAAFEKARTFLQGFSLEEKVNVSTGVGWQNGRCVGNIPANEEKGFPGLCLEDSPLGVRFGDFVTAFPTGIHAASTWNRELIRLRGLLMGREHRGKGVNVALGPMMNMGRLAQGGRNWEGFGADPFLAGEAAYETILGLQHAGVQGCAKHYIGNEQEHKRTSTSSFIEDRTIHEIYAHPFMRSVMAGVASVMCSYNLINQTYACENDKTQNDILKREFGFRGYIMSDWQATMSTYGSVFSGLDMTMPGDITFNSGDSYFGGNLTTYVQNNTIPSNRVDDMAERIIAAWFLLHQDSPDYPSVNFNAFHIDDDATNERVDVQADHFRLVREMGRRGMVLLKNENSALPLTGSERSILIAGIDAAPQPGGPNQFGDQGGNEGILAMGWGSGTANFPYLISPYEAIQARARQNRSTLVDWDFMNFDLNTAMQRAARKDVAFVFVNSDSGEDYIPVDGNEGDRKNLTSWHGGDALIRAVASVNPNTVVVVHSVGPLILEDWVEHPNVTAILWAGVSGQEAGNSLVDVLYGDYNPTGRLPYTIAKNMDDYNTQLLTAGDTNDMSHILSIPYNEGLLIDYRWFDAKNITPRYEFGFGLSYTKFKYSGLSITALPSPLGGSSDETQAISRWESGKSTLITEGSSTATWLHRPAFKVSFTLTNTGHVKGGEIPQLYLAHPSSEGEPPLVLKGFTNVDDLEVGEGREVVIYLSRHDVSVWDTEDQGWRRPKGDLANVGVVVGASSRDGRLRGHLPSL